MRKQPRVLVVRAGGLAQQQHNFTLWNFLARQAFVVSVVNIAEAGGTGGPSQLDPRISLYQIPFFRARNLRSFWSRLVAARQLRSQISNAQADILYVIDPGVLLFVALASLGNFFRRRFQLVYHTFEWSDPVVDSGVNIWLERQMCRQARLVVNIDRARAGVQKMLYRLTRTPLNIPVLLSREHPLPERNLALRQELLGPKSPAEAVLLVYPSTASPSRLTLELIEAFACLPPRYRLFALADDNAYGRSCRARVEHLGLEKRVAFSHSVPHARMMEFLACSDIGAIFHDAAASSGNFLCHPARLGLFVAMGLPFVATAVPSLEAEVYKHQLGFCCDPFNAKATAAAIRQLVEDSPGLPARREHLRQVFRSELHFEKHATVLAKELRQLIGDGA